MIYKIQDYFTFAGIEKEMFKVALFQLHML